MSVKTNEPRPARQPSWEEYWATVGDENYLFARELIDLSGPLRAHLVGFTEWRESPCLVDDGHGDWVPDPDGWVWREADLDWAKAAAVLDDWAASSTERRLVALVLSMIQPDQEHDPIDGGIGGIRTINVRDLGRMGSWADAIGEILGRYIAGGQPRTP